MKPQKMEWVTPELTVLVRNKPEEAVLAACKGIAVGPTDTAGPLCHVGCTAALCNASLPS